MFFYTIKEKTENSGFFSKKLTICLILILFLIPLCFLGCGSSSSTSTPARSTDQSGELTKIRIYLSAESNFCFFGDNLTITTNIIDLNNNTPVSNHLVSFSVNLGCYIEPNAITNQDGTAQVTFTSGNTKGTATIEAQVEYNGEIYTQDLNIQIEELPPVDPNRVELSVDPLIIFEGKTANIIATIYDSNNRTVPDGMAVSFTTNIDDCQIDPPSAHTLNGSASATFTAGNTTGTATITATTQTRSRVPISDTVQIEIISIPLEPAYSITLSENPDPYHIYIKGTDMDQEAKITFKVLDKNGQFSEDGVQVEFILLNNGLRGGEKLVPGAGTSASDGAFTIDGRVSTVLHSGIKSGVVKIMAFIDSLNNGKPDPSEVQSATVSIVISDGFPYGEYFGVYADILNIPALDAEDVQDPIMVLMADKNHNQVSPLTKVYFTSDYAEITGPNSIINNSNTSKVQGTLTSNYNFPVDGFVHVNASSNTGIWGRILCMERHPKDPNILYVGTDGGGIFKSTNSLSDDPNSINWHWINSFDTGSEKGLTCGIIRDIVIDKYRPHIVYAATDRGVFRSLGQGDKWVNISNGIDIYNEFVGMLDSADYNLNNYDTNSYDPTNNYEGLSRAYTLKYPWNGNRTKTKVYLDGMETTAYICNGRTLNIIVGGASSPRYMDGAEISIDYHTGNNLPGYCAYSIAIDANSLDSNYNILYVAIYGKGVYKSINNGIAWSHKNVGLINNHILSMKMDPQDPNILYACTLGGGIFKTTNGGDKWTPINNGLTASVITTIFIDPDNSNRLFAGSIFDGIFLSNDGGMTWSVPDVNVNAYDPDNTFVKDFAMNEDRDIFAATYTDNFSSIGGVFKSIDNGLTWERAESLENNGVFCLNSINDQVFAGTYNRRIFRITKNENTWTLINENRPEDLYRIFDTARVLFSGDPIITLTPIKATYLGYGDYSTLYNTGTVELVFTACDRNGNPLIAGTEINVSSSTGILGGAISHKLSDVQSGDTEYWVSFFNDNISEEAILGTLTCSVKYVKDGETREYIIEYSIILNGILSIKPESIDIDAGGETIEFSGTGGSESTNYVWSTTGGTFANGIQTESGTGIVQLTTTGNENGRTITVTLTDTLINQKAVAIVSQGEKELVIIPGSGTLRSGGDELMLIASGGSGIAANYHWITGAGVLVNPGDGTQGNELTGLKRVILRTTEADDGRNFVVVLNDLVMEQEIFVDITQQEKEVAPEEALIVLPSEGTLRIGGDELLLTASGGSGVAANYHWITGAGVLVNPDDGTQGNALTGLKYVIVRTTSADDRRNFIIVLSDIATGQEVSASISQQELDVSSSTQPL